MQKKVTGFLKSGITILLYHKIKKKFMMTYMILIKMTVLFLRLQMQNTLWNNFSIMLKFKVHFENTKLNSLMKLKRKFIDIMHLILIEPQSQKSYSVCKHVVIRRTLNCQIWYSYIKVEKHSQNIMVINHKRFAEKYTMYNII